MFKSNMSQEQAVKLARILGLLSMTVILAACSGVSDENEADASHVVALDELAAPVLAEGEEAFDVAVIGEPVESDYDVDLGYFQVKGIGFLSCSEDNRFYTLYTEQGADTRVVISMPPDIDTGEHDMIGIGEMDGFSIAAGELVLDGEDFLATDGDGTLTIDAFPTDLNGTLSGSFEMLVGRGEDRIRMTGAFNHNNIGRLCE